MLLYNKSITRTTKRISEKKREAYQEDLEMLMAWHTLGPLMINIPTVVQGLLPDRRPLYLYIIKLYSCTICIAIRML